MKKLILYVFCLMFPVIGSSQIEDPTSWSFDVEDLGEGTYNLLANVEIDEGWIVYSQYKDPESFIVSTSFYFKNIDGLKFIDSETEKVDYPMDGYKVFFSETQPIEKYVPIVEETAKYFEGKASFVQKIEVEGAVDQIQGMYEFMVCDDEQCLPPEIVDVVFYLKKKELTENTKDKNSTNLQVECSEKYKRQIKGIVKVEEKGNDKGVSLFKLLEALLAGVIAGLIALVTPCVFPMIPLTVSFFLKGSENRKKAIFRASLYGGFIVLIYFLLSLPFYFFSLDANVLNQISTDGFLNLIFFLVFTVFAISFFGFFEIRLPSKLLNKVDSASEVGGVIGIFFMALTLALVSFSCTGPVLGAALAKTSLSASGSSMALQLSSAMIGFGLALGVPFGLFAVFPTWLKSLPKSGGWMNTLKVFIGFLELALAIKFLSNADAVYKFGFIKYETFFVLWSLTFLGLALYLFGIIKFPHDQKSNSKLNWGKIFSGFVVALCSVFFLFSLPLFLFLFYLFLIIYLLIKLQPGFSRIVFAWVALFFVLYLMPGATCKYQDVFTHTLFGLPPPKTYSYCHQEVERIETKDYFEAIELSKKYNKPILVDFTGMACVNCRKLENQVWNDEEVDKLISQYILAQLYVDVRTELTDEEFACNPNNRDVPIKINTTGKQWSTLQAHTFEKNTQPLHIILKPSDDPNYDEELLKDKNGNHVQPKAYKDANNIDTYKNWLEQGLKDFHSE